MPTVGSLLLSRLQAGLRLRLSGSCAPTLMLPRLTTAAPAGDAEFHFSYGANMASGILAKRGVTPLASRPAVVTEPATVLSFRHRGGFATLVMQPMQQQDAANPRLQRGNVHGVLYSLDRADMAALQRAETGYVLERVSVQPYPRVAKAPCVDAGEIRPARPVSVVATTDASASIVPDDATIVATAFVSRPTLRLRSPVAPTDRYLEHMQTGAREHGLCPEYVAWLASVPSVSRSGLPPEYFDTGPNLVAQGFLVLVGLAFATLSLRHECFPS